MKIFWLPLALAAALLAGCPKEEVKTNYVPVDRNVTINNQPPPAPVTNTVIHDETVVHDAATARPNNVTINNHNDPAPVVTPTAMIVHDRIIVHDTATAPPNNVTIQNQIIVPTATPSP